jgi:hypothetical protein
VFKLLLAPRPRTGSGLYSSTNKYTRITLSSGLRQQREEK